jgi:hypothetical protein
MQECALTSKSASIWQASRDAQADGRDAIFGLAVLVALSALSSEPPNYALEPNESDQFNGEYSP